MNFKTVRRFALFAICSCLFGQGTTIQVNFDVDGPSELRVDLLLRVLESRAVHLSAKEEVLRLQDAFSEADRATQSLRTKGLPGTNVESRTNYLAMALEKDVDTLSLRARILQRLEPDVAVKTLFTVSAPTIPPLTCEQAWTWKVESYYKALTTLANSGFSPKEISDGRRVDFIGQYALNLRSAAQIGPAAGLIREVRLEHKELQSVMAVFVSRLSTLRDGPRALWIGTGYEGFRRINELFQYCKGQNAFAEQLIAAYRAFLAANSSAVCQDLQFTPSSFPLFASDFNWFIEQNPKVGARRLEYADLKPNFVEGKARPDLFEVRTDNGQIDQRIRKLRADLESGGDDDWGSRFRGLVDEARTAFDKQSVERFDIFHEQCVLLRALRMMARDQSERDICDDALIGVLENSPVENSSPPEWLMHALGLVTTTASDKSGAALARVAASRNAILNEYAKLAALK